MPAPAPTAGGLFRCVAVALLTVALAGCGGGAATGRLSSVATSSRTPGCTVPKRFLGREVERLPVAQKLVALTFDAGANADAVKPILDTLAARHVPATFFLTGRFVQDFPKRSARIGRHYLVGNHTNTHPDLTTLTDRQVRRQVRTAQRLIVQGTGQDPRRFFRFPFGARNRHTIDLVNGLCYVPFRWTVDTLGWEGTSGGMTAAQVVDRVVAGEQPGEVVLMHVGSNPDDGSTLDADALPRVIKRLRGDGYRLVRLSRVLASGP
ncbi:MAG TPA: polysaccharide deacetylase family protein [Marmoricola sp.]